MKTIFTLGKHKIIVSKKLFKTELKIDDCVQDAVHGFALANFGRYELRGKTDDEKEITIKAQAGLKNRYEFYYKNYLIQRRYVLGMV